MEIKNTKNGDALVIALTGRLDTTTAPDLDKVAKESLADIKDLTLDISKLEYISSAGLRVLLSMQKVMNKQGKMVIKGANDSIKEIFELTGFNEVLTVL